MWERETEIGETLKLKTEKNNIREDYHVIIITK